MSERLKTTNNYSNEEIIEDLTKGLKSSLSTEDKEEDFVINPGSSAETFPSSPGDMPVKTEKSGASRTIPLHEELNSELDETEKAETFKIADEEEKADSDTDSINEVHLKDKEMDLTDDEKAERSIIAEQLKTQGNDAFKCGEFQRSIDKYTEGLQTCPLSFSQQRSVLFCNRAAAKMKLERYESAAKDCSKAVKLDDRYLKAYIRRASCYELTEKFDESLADYKKILELDPSHKEAQKALIRLPPLIEERNEKLKAEMLGKLKDLGNMILKPFGLSTENFQLQQDPDSKGYKINFKQ